mgnify:CR=1 FL=1
MGVDPRGFSKGKRGIAGSLIFTIFDRSALGRIINEEGRPVKYFARATDIASPGEYSATTGNRIRREDTEGLAANRNQTVTTDGLFFTNDQRVVNYVDQIPPFDVVLSAQNEVGNRMYMQIFGIQLLNQGSGVSVDD